MSTFYLLPPREVLGQRVAGFLQTLAPGLTWQPECWAELADLAAAALASQPDVFVVFREEIPEGEETARVLRELFGARPGDVLVDSATASRSALSPAA